MILKINISTDSVISTRSEFEGGDLILVQNIKKTKSLPGTKNEEKYLGPYLVSDVTPSHIVAQKDPSSSKTTRLPIHLSRKYQKRDPEVNIIRCESL